MGAWRIVFDTVRGYACQKSLYRQVFTGFLGRLQVVMEFRRHSAEADPTRRAQNLQLARDYNFLLQSIREHKVILSLTAA